MLIHPLHSWDLSPAAAVAVQRDLASRTDTATPVEKFDLVAGADVSYNRYSNIFHAAVIVFRPADNTIVEAEGIRREVHFPYIPGLLSFREAPALLDCFARLKSEPDVIMMDGQGIAHPRRLGIAAHVGLWLQRPCVGCAKSLLCGTYEEPAAEAGSRSPLTAGEEVIGAVLRTKHRVNPLYVSPGHKIDLESSVRCVLATCRGYRLPEPTRQAHLHVNLLRQKYGDERPPDDAGVSPVP